MNNLESGRVFYLPAGNILEPGHYVFLDSRGDEALVCLAGEDEGGNITTTDKLFRIGLAELQYARLAMLLPPEVVDHILYPRPNPLLREI